MDAVYYVSIVAQVLTYISFLSGAKVCHSIYKQKSSAQFSPIPFLAGLNCTVLWLKYGFLSGEWEIIAVNLVGLACQVVYMSFFVVYTRQKATLLKQLTTLAILLLAIFWSINHSVDPLFLAGALASLSSLIACASPLATIQDVFKTKCVATLPFPIIVSSFVVSVSWLTYGYLKQDDFIVFSNIVASFLSGFQLSLFLIYPSRSPYEKLSQSNKKSYDLIKLLNSEDDELETFDVDDISIGREIDTNQDYKETLTRIMGQIYVKREQLSKKSGAIMLLFTI